MPATSALVRIVPPMREEHLRERLADAMHAALDDAAADILDRRDEHPREVASQRIVRGEPGVQSGRREEEPHLGAFEGLLDPRAGRLHDEPIAVRSVGRTELLDETRGPAVHGAHDGGFGRREPSVERPPGVGVAPREPGDARRRGLDIPTDHEGATVREDLRPVGARRDQLEPVLRESELIGRWRQLGDEIAARMNVGEVARCGDLLGDRHPSDGRVALERHDFQPGPREIAGAGQAVVSRADDSRVV